MFMQHDRRLILAVFSDVNFSPQLTAILQELHNQGATFRVILIGDNKLKIAQQMQILGWDSITIRNRGKLGSILNFLVISYEIIRKRPQTLFASGQFATPMAMLSAKLFNVPQRIFIRHHSSFHHKFEMKLGILVDKMANRLATGIVAVSAVVKNILIQNERVNPEKVTMIFNGVDLVKFQNLTINSLRMVNHEKKTGSLFHIGVISRLTEWKGVEYTALAFIRLQKEFPNTRLHIVGAFSDSYTAVKKTLSLIEPNLYTLEKVNSDIPNFLRGLDAFVHVPVGLDDEAFGIVYVEALAAGIPCIFTRSGVLNELEDPDRYVSIVGYRTPEEIYLNLKRILQGTSASKSKVPDLWLNQFSLDSMAKHYSKLILGEEG